jgi:hypothetical protein
MAVQNPPVKGGFEPPVMSFSAVVSAYYSVIETAVFRAAMALLV